MRHAWIVQVFAGVATVALVGVAGCEADSRVVRGRMIPGSDATDVYVVGQPVRSVVEGDSFRLAGVEGDTVELEFTEGRDRLGRMRIEEWGGSELTLEGIWLEDGIAFATRLGPGSAGARVNGLRLAAPQEMPARVDVQGVVLSASRDGDALVVRPLRGELPDLRVVVTPGTAIEGGDPEEKELDLDFGDSLRLEGIVEGGYVVATRLVLAPPDGAEDAGGGGGRRDQGRGD